MGFSCSREAGYTLEAIKNYCVKNTGSSNVFWDRGQQYFIEWGNRSHKDGAITGSVYHVHNERSCRRTNSIRIEPNGKVTRGPSILKELPIYRVTFYEKTLGEYTELWADEEPTQDNLEKAVLSHSQQYEAGGINYHVSKALGYIPYPSYAVITDVDGTKICEWEAAKFQVY